MGKGELINSLWLALFLPLTALGAPDWMHALQTEDSLNYYFVQVVPAPSPQCRSCYEEARKIALIEMVRALFGTDQKFEISTYENEKTISTHVQSSEKIPMIRTRSFREVARFYDEEAKSLAIRFVFAKAEYQQLLQQLTSSKATSDIDEFVEVNGQGGVGLLKFTTEPSGAEVFIDGKRWGETPMVLKNKLLPGVHSLTLDQTDSENWNEEIVVTAQTLNFHRILRPATMTLEIDADFNGAEVTIDGQVAGKTPLSAEVSLQPDHSSIEVRLTHPHAFMHREFVHFEKGEIVQRKIQLSPKPSTLVVSCRQYPCAVRVDDKAPLTIKNTTSVKVAVGSHIVSGLREGFESPDQLIEIAGGEVKTLPPFVFSRKVEEVVEPVKQTQFSFAPYREFAVQPETAKESVPLMPQPSMVSQGIYVLQEGDPTPKVQNSFARNGVGYQLALNSRWLGIGAGAVFFPRERKGSVLDRGESGYLLLNVNLTEEFSVQFQQGIRNKVIEDDDLTVSYYFRQGFKKVGLHFILLPRTSDNFGYFMDLGGVTFSSPFRLEKPTLTYYLALGMEI